MDQKVVNELVRESRLDFLLETYKMGLTISPEDKEMLIKHKRIEDTRDPIKGPKIEKKDIITDLNVKSDIAKEADKNIDVIYEENIDQLRDTIITSTEGLEGITKGTEYAFDGSLEIIREDWLPLSKLEHERDFVEWIDSINSGFRNKKYYKKFALYVQQSKDWLSENSSITDFGTRQARVDYIHQEITRCRENSLYGLDKYLMLKEGDLSSGSMKYESKPVHEVICYMFDCGYSMFIGKGRQIAATSTLGGCAMLKTIVHKNFFIKFITQDKETGEEIFEDKIKHPFSEMPDFLKPEVSNDRDNLFKLGKKDKKKGSKKGVNSKIKVVAPSVSAINGGSPQIVMIDEAGYIGILGRMMKEARPTMFMQNPITGKLEMKRQIIAWGTGGLMDAGGKAYEEEYNNAFKKWEKREFDSGMIPIFLDWTTRPGITQEHFDSEKKVYTVEGPDREKTMVQFRQTYPSIKEDMFLTSSKTLISIDYINRNIERIRKYPHSMKPQKGYFEPIYDYDKPAGENEDVPFKIIGANFVPTEDEDARASCSVFMHPKKNWVNRYYSGVDPIMSDNGYSNMSNTVFDNHLKTVSAIMNYRDPDHKYTFLQTMLLSLYYGTKIKGVMHRCPELVESNIGTAYCDYVETKGFSRSLVLRTELPDYMQGGNSIIGIDNRAQRTKFILHKLVEYISAYGTRNCIDVFFEQLRTFVCTFTAAGNETWGTADKRKYHDDVLFSTVFAYICSLSFEYKIPKEIKSESDNVVISYPTVRDSNGNLTRRMVRKKIR